VVLATGARWRNVGVPGEDAYRNHGVAYCPHCDGPLYKGRRVAVIGGGARSRFWGRILAAALDRPLHYHAGAEHGPAFGAARLARLAVTGEDPAAVCTAPPVETVIEPEPALRDRYAARLGIYRALYESLRSRFREL
jgi:sugar (pentulose or hexulose) kinase